jgi:hypothetical protein
VPADTGTSSVAGSQPYADADGRAYAHAATSDSPRITGPRLPRVVGVLLERLNWRRTQLSGNAGLPKSL